MICPICKSNNTDLLLDYGQYPYFTVPLKKKDKKKILAQYRKDQLFSELKYTACKDCGHVYINQIPDQDIIDDLYSNYYSYPSPLKGEFEPARDNHFINIFKKVFNPICRKRNLENVLEVGCFDGYILYNLKKKGYNVTGCDPSIGADIGKSFGINIQKENFSPEHFIKDGNFFDIIISRHFIEHTSEPENFILGLEKILNNNGLLIIETPNIQHFLQKGLLEVFSLQHITLFTSKSIEYLLNQAGFKVIHTETTPDNLILAAVKSKCKKNVNPNLYNSVIDRFKIRVSENKQRINRTLYKKFSKYNSRISIWGAGGFGIAALTLYEIPPEKIDCYIDSDPQKWGMEYITNSLPIISPEETKDPPPDLIIAASMYGDGILSTIKNMKFNCPTLLISPDVLLELSINSN